jgi:hypothetical protein
MHHDTCCHAATRLLLPTLRHTPTRCYAAARCCYWCTRENGASRLPRTRETGLPQPSGLILEIVGGLEAVVRVDVEREVVHVEQGVLPVPNGGVLVRLYDSLRAVGLDTHREQEVEVH